MPAQTPTPESGRTITYAVVRNEQYVHVGQLTQRLREAGWDDIADWILRSAHGRITRTRKIH